MVDALMAIPAERHIVVAGEMLELGPEAEALHAACGQGWRRVGWSLFLGFAVRLRRWWKPQRRGEPRQFCRQPGGGGGLAGCECACGRRSVIEGFAGRAAGEGVDGCRGRFSIGCFTRGYCWLWRRRLCVVRRQGRAGVKAPLRQRLGPNPGSMGRRPPKLRLEAVEEDGEECRQGRSNEDRCMRKITV